MRRGALPIICAAAIAVLAPSSALAAPGTLTDNQFEGTTDGTEVAAGNVVRLTASGPLYEFDDTLPVEWTAFPWPGGSAPTFAGGEMIVDGALVYENALAGDNQVMETSATFGGDDYQQLGYAVDFNDPPWAMFSTGGGPLQADFYARTLPAPGEEIDTPLPGVNPTEAHDYRIEWAPTQVRFFVDGAPVATHAVEFDAQMHPAVSDLTPDGNAVEVAWVQSGPYTTGSFTSRVLGGIDDRTVWQTLTTPPGTTGVSFETRSGNTATPDASWSAFTPVGAGGAIQSRFARFIQYRATFTATDATVSPTLASVTIDYNIDDVKPTTAISGIVVALDTATVSFSAQTRTSSGSSAAGTVVRWPRAPARVRSPVCCRARTSYPSARSIGSAMWATR